jgi:predicted nucleic acid-binding protein
MMFFDSYALIEIFQGNKNYKKYKEEEAITSFLHVFEVYYALKRVLEDKDFKDFFYRLRNFCVDLEYEWIPEAVDFKLKNKSANLSYADCLGYIIAKEKGVKFLTGDKEFEKLPNVEFVK